MFFALCTKTPHGDYIAWFQLIATFFLGLAVAYVAWQQFRVARNKLRLDLFDRRYKVYEATKQFVDAIVGDPTHVDSYLHDFNTGTSNAEFLFEADVLNYINQVGRGAVHMRTAWHLSETSPDREERIRNSEKYEADLSSLGKRASEVTKVFDPYLGFQNVKI